MAHPTTRTGFDNGIVVLAGEPLALIARLLEDAALVGATVRIAIDEGLKLSIDRGTWSPPIGEVTEANA